MSVDVRGPVEFAVIEFERAELDGAVAPALAELVHDGTVHIIDLAFLSKATDGALSTFELEDLAADVATAFDAIEGEAGGLFADDDLRHLGDMLRPDSSAIVVMWEAAWARRLASAVLGSGGELVVHEMVDRRSIDELLDETTD